MFHNNKPQSISHFTFPFNFVVLLTLTLSLHSTTTTTTFAFTTPTPSQRQSSSSVSSVSSSMMMMSKKKKEPIVTTIISESTMEESYNKLARRIRDNVLTSLPNGEQYWVAIAGGPGSGKTTTANEVAKRLNNNHQDGTTTEEKEKEECCCCVVLPMDGFHFSKEELAQMDPPNGDKFMKRRGAPWTMNAELCYQLLKQAKTNKSAELPSYSREISDPVPGGVTLLSNHRIVLVEGLYLLWADDPRWEPLQALWDERWFIKCPSRDDQRERLIQRSLENWNERKIKDWGPGREGAIAKVDANDGPNMDLVAPSEGYADVIIESK